MGRSHGSDSLRATKAVSSGDQPSNSAATRPRAAVRSPEAIGPIHSSGLFSAAYPRTCPSAYRWTMMPLPGASAISVPLPIAAALARWLRSSGVRAISTKQVPL
ncbi:hypothetical protein [Kitasatospora sp. NRRL B-11411]|uniref:hypothetical protein n=1 Tax=Kitasatospora sp. NRRL B-11411 TaxID=1463822 RepID=UPI0004C301BD|nr:hypothetical protein [Kitasatospora sp. NRRL B-11411]